MLETCDDCVGGQKLFENMTTEQIRRSRMDYCICWHVKQGDIKGGLGFMGYPTDDLEGEA